MKSKITFLLTLFWMMGINRSIGQSHHSLIINEIMADPSPVVQLPLYEWVEIKNNSKELIQLLGWKLVAGNSVSSPFPSYFLSPDSLLIVCSSSAAILLKNYGSTIGLSSFPALNNEGETLSLRAPNGKTIHAVTYSQTWYGVSWKQEGGWSLELIDKNAACWATDNWTASVDSKGGSPGKPNSQFGKIINSATLAPLYAYAPDNKTVAVYFNRPVDSSSSVNKMAYTFNRGYVAESIRILPPAYDQAIITLNKSLEPDTILRISFSSLMDCSFNTMNQSLSIQTGLATTAQKGSLFINEILFNPRPNAFDFAEIGNKSKQLIDLSKIVISNRTSAGQLGTSYKIRESPFLLFPDQLFALTEDTSSLKREYFIPPIAQLCQVKQMPTMPDEVGSLVILTINGDIIDEVHYNESWHFPLLQSNEGVSLERIDRAVSSTIPSNWHSAASTEGFATPGRKNSQEKLTTIPNALFEITPVAFSPDGDGWQDYCLLSYTTRQNGQMATITIADATGRIIKRLVPQALLATAGYFIWNGENDKGQLCAPGNYIVIIEQFNLNGITRTTRLPLVVTYSFKKF
jgi:hypothetical protein